MSKPGPKPVPKRVKEMRGSRIRGEHVTAVEVKRAIPVKPLPLDQMTAALWEYYARVLFPMGVLAESDGMAITRLAEATAEATELTELCRKNGIKQMSPNGYAMLSPDYIARNQALAREHKLLCEFGLTPSARVRVVSIPAAPVKNVTESLLD